MKTVNLVDLTIKQVRVSGDTLPVDFREISAALPSSDKPNCVSSLRNNLPILDCYTVLGEGEIECNYIAYTPEFERVVGNPAKIVKKLRKELEEAAGKFWEERREKNGLRRQVILLKGMLKAMPFIDRLIFLFNPNKTYENVTKFEKLQQREDAF